MSEAKNNRFLTYFPVLLDALRSTHPTRMRPAEARAWIRSKIDVPPEDLTRLIKNGQQSIFENDVHWARFYLAKAKLIDSAKRGLWGLTQEGMNTYLAGQDAGTIYDRIRESTRPGATVDEEGLPAPGAVDEESGEVYWFAGATWHKADMLQQFLASGIWENGEDDQFSQLVRRMKPGDRIAIKASFVQKHNLPFQVEGKAVSAMRIKATGTVLENFNDGRKVRVVWDPPAPPRIWYFYTYRTTLVEANLEDEGAQRLVDFTFRGGVQDYSWFLTRPYWAEKYGSKPLLTDSTPTDSHSLEETIDDDEEPTYTVDNIIDEGCFLPADEIGRILERWRSKKNLVLQGPPGTGKTWLAKRLGFALLGSNSREAARSRLRVVQFHPSLVYEDFVRGWRPTGDGRLSLVDGILMQAIDAAASEPDRPFVLVIEEINRGNPAQIFGEMLTLLEDSKRLPSEAIELAYRRAGEHVHVPKNLYVIGTMNVADRSLAIVDLALRRRFAFIDLEPQLGSAWRSWCLNRGLDDEMLSEIETRVESLNREIAETNSLGPQFRIGHSYVTPDDDERVADGKAWFHAKVITEIGPLLDEYWYDAPQRAREARARLLAKLY